MKNNIGKIFLGTSIIIASMILSFAIVIASTNIGQSIHAINDEFIYYKQNLKEAPLDQQIFTLEEAADYMRIDDYKLLNMLKNREGINFIQFGDDYRISKEEIDKWFKDKIILLDQ